MESLEQNNFSTNVELNVETRLCTEKDFESMYDMMYSHNKIAGIKINKPSFENFKNKFNSNILTFGYFVDNKLTSFLVTRKLLEIPSWYVSMISVERSLFFDFKKSGLPELFDTAITHWESQEIFSFILIQSIKHRNLLNGRILQHCKKLSNYQIPGATLEIIKQNTLSSSSLIRELCKNNVYDEDKIVKWVFRKDYHQENFK
jgi:hypothetical protein